MEDNLKVIFHIDEIEKWDILCANINNFLKAGEKGKIEVEVLVNSIAVKGLLKSDGITSDLEKNLFKMKENGVNIYVCENSLKGLKITKEDIFSFIESVNSGVFYLALQQSRGFAYIKP